jgi:DNA-binding transcriptional LysR family regulator
MRGLNVDHLRAFADVIELGSFSAAADRLGLTQPAVSLQVRQLERRFGVRLIERVGRRARPTAAGEDLLAHVRSIEGATEAAADAMARHASGAIGRVRLGTGATACIHLLPPVLRELRRRFPSLEIVVSTGNTADVLRSLEENAIDLGLVTLPAPGRMFEVTPLLEDEFVAIAPAEQAGLPERVTPAALSSLPLLLYEPGGNTRRIVDGWFARADVAPRPIMALGNIEAIKVLVGAGLGFAVLPAMAVAVERARQPLLVRPLTPRLSRELGLVLRRDKPLSRGLREVVNAITRLRT